jgi:hypothetical protein
VIGKIIRQERDFRAKWWEIQEGEDIYPILNLKQFSTAYGLDYERVHYWITHYGEYQDERFTIRRHAPDRDIVLRKKKT